MDSPEDSVEALVQKVDELQRRVSDLEAENQQRAKENRQLREENQRLREQLDEKDQRIDQLEARLRQYENPHTPPSKQRNTSSSGSRGSGDDDARTDGGTVGRAPGHEPAFRTPPDPDETIDETGIKRDGDQAWVWTFRTAEHTLFAVRESRGSAVPREVLGEEFEGTIVCDGWTAYPAFSDDLQLCWAHLLREAEDLAADHEAAKPIHRYLEQMYAGLTSWVETDPSAHRSQERRSRYHTQRRSRYHTQLS